MALTPLGIAVLGLLAERPMHPYEMYQMLLLRREDQLVKVRPGSLYHTVDRLAAAELVKATGTARDGNRPERTTYEITADGRDTVRGRVREILERPVREYPIFPLGISEAHNLGRDEVVTLLRRRVERLDDEVAALDIQAGFADEHDVPVVYWLSVGYQRTMLQAEIAWITDLIDRMTHDRIHWLDHETGAVGPVPTSNPT